MKKRIMAMLAGLLLLCACGKEAESPANAEAATTITGEPGSMSKEDVEAMESNVYAVIEVQDVGTIKVKLAPECAPITVQNFIDLAKSGFYDGLTFHRIMYGFMMQGGDPLGNGTGGSENNIKGEFADNGVNNPLSHTRGAISMARNGFDMDSASSQFFIMHQDGNFLDGQYACFGYVTEGMEVVDIICGSAKPVDNNGSIPADEQPVITSITIEEG